MSANFNFQRQQGYFMPLQERHFQIPLNFLPFSDIIFSAPVRPNEAIASFYNTTLRVKFITKQF